MRLAVLDLGPGSFHLAVFEVGPRGVLTARRSWSVSVRLDAEPGGRLARATWARGLAAVHRLLRDLDAFDSRCEVVAVASSALRALPGGPAFCDDVSRRVAVELLSAETEARLNYLGARSQLAGNGRLVVADLGAGSLELASGRGGESDLAFSVPLGMLGLRDVYLHPERALDRAARERIAATVRFGAGEAARAIWDRRPDRLAFTSGIAAALAALAGELDLGRPGAQELGVADLARLVDVLAQFQPIELPALALGIDEARSDTVAVGAVVMHTLMELLGFESALIVPAGRREGVAVRHMGISARAVTDGQVHTAVT
jgi:exopolyphosphatase/guanosine-5'-triphosphate,3'-diphosphate pyrophosphatase